MSKVFAASAGLLTTRNLTQQYSHHFQRQCSDDHRTSPGRQHTKSVVTSRSSRSSTHMPFEVPYKWQFAQSADCRRTQLSPLSFTCEPPLPTPAVGCIQPFPAPYPCSASIQIIQQDRPTVRSSRWDRLGAICTSQIQPPVAHTGVGIICKWESAN